MSDADLAHAGLNLHPGDELTPTQAETAVFGFWVFLMSDAVIFALLFATYGVMLEGSAGGPTPATEFKIGGAFVETLILLTSSFTFGMASIAMKYEGRCRGLIAWLGTTLVLGIVFLILEVQDFAAFGSW